MWLSAKNYLQQCALNIQATLHKQLMSQWRLPGPTSVLPLKAH